MADPAETIIIKVTPSFPETGLSVSGKSVAYE